MKFSGHTVSGQSGAPSAKEESERPAGRAFRHIREDSRMSWFDFAVQFLDPSKMTYWGKPRDADFWIENASVEWNEAEAPFHRRKA